MKIQLDTSAKTIKIDGDVNLSELFNMLDKLLPNGEWKDFELQTNVTIERWSNPIIIEKSIPHIPYTPYTPYVPYTNPTRPYKWYCDADSAGNVLPSLMAGTYNIEC